MVLAYLRPDSDDSISDWTDQAGGTTSIYTGLDETTLDDADYVKSPVPAGSTARFRLSNPASGKTLATPVVVRYRFKKILSADQKLDVTLKQGSTTIATWSHTGGGLTESFQTVSQTLSAPQLASITDFDSLFVEFQASAAAAAVLELHLDASVAASVTASSTLVSQWNDLSGNARHLTQSVGANKPIYPGATQNSLNTMVFGDSSAVTFLSNTSTTINQRFLVFWVINNLGGGGALLFDNTSGTSRVTITAQDGANHQSIAAAVANIYTTTAISGWAVLCGDCNGASSAIYLNGTQEATGDPGPANITSVQLGCRYDGTTLPFSGFLGELRIYTNPQAGDIANITTALRSKWGI